MRLMERWFPSVEEEQERKRQQKEADSFQRERIREFLEVGYMGEHKTWLAEIQLQYRPQVGSHEQMIHNAGVWEGLQLVKTRLEDLERQLEKQ